MVNTGHARPLYNLEVPTTSEERLALCDLEDEFVMDCLFYMLTDSLPPEFDETLTSSHRLTLLKAKACLEYQMQAVRNLVLSGVVVTPQAFRVIF